MLAKVFQLINERGSSHFVMMFSCRDSDDEEVQQDMKIKGLKGFGQ